MSEPRCMPNQYYANEHSPFGTKYTYQAPHDIQKMLNAEYHKGKSSELQTGDVIRLCQTRTGSTRRSWRRQRSPSLTKVRRVR